VFLRKVILAFTRAVRLDEIPPEYKNLKIIGRGNTSIILEKDANTVIMLTRDAMKKDWLSFGISIAKDWKIHDIKVKAHRFKDFSLYAIEMPKLYPLSPSRRRSVQRELAFFDKALINLHLGKFKAKEELPKIMDYYEQNKKEDSIIYKLMEFLQNYYPDQWNWDLARRQFAQDNKGDIILVDPIADSALTKLMHEEYKKEETRLYAGLEKG